MTSLKWRGLGSIIKSYANQWLGDIRQLALYNAGYEMHMTVTRNVTGTAFVVAEFRAEENRELHPLYRDPIVPLFLDEETRRAAERILRFLSSNKKTWSG